MAKKSQAKKAASAEKKLANIDRFAGSSEESANADDSSLDDSSTDGDAVGAFPIVVEREKEAKFLRDKKGEINRELDKDEEKCSVSSDVSAEDNEEDFAGLQLTSGMANAMAKILNGTVKESASSVVLSKTKTPLQILATKEKKQQKDLVETRKRNRESKLSALHVPLSIATTALSVSENDAGKNVTVELDQERVHRRVATRGIVALFNAIAQHQQQQPVPTAESIRKGKPSKLTKESFLEKIKQTAQIQKTPSTTCGGGKWDALKDEYMMNSKKNWDEESSEEEQQQQVKKRRHKSRT